MAIESGMKSEEGVMQSNLVKLTPQYLRNRHEFWKEEIGKVGIWDSNKFMPIKLIIRKNHRRYNALFQRRRNLRNNTFEDKIVVYNKVESFEIKFLDSLIVHEMIHQYQKGRRALVIGLGYIRMANLING